MKMYTKIIKPLITGTISAVLLTAVLLLIDPTDKSVVYILLPVILSWVCLFSLLQVIGTIVLRGRHALYTVFSMVMASAAVLLLLLSGLGQLTIRDVVLTLLLTSIASFYIYRTWSKD